LNLSPFPDTLLVKLQKSAGGEKRGKAADRRLCERRVRVLRQAEANLRFEVAHAHSDMVQ
jgi:hypothetical protein